MATQAVEIPRHRITLDEFNRMIAAGVFAEDDRLELVDGEIVELAPIFRPHAEGVMTASEIFAERAGRRVVMWVQNPIALPPHGRPQPDVVLLEPPRSRYRGRLPRPEDILLLIEVADSSLAFDRDRKVHSYGRGGVREAWVVDVNNRLLLLYSEPGADGYRVVRTARPGEIVAPLALPDCRIDVEEVLPAADGER
jgi:Uma2 family endonuclease